MPAKRHTALSAHFQALPNAFEILYGQRIQRYADGEAALQFGNEILHLCHMKRPCRNEQHMIGLDRAILGIHRAALHNGKNIPLHALTRNIRATAAAV